MGHSTRSDSPSLPHGVKETQNKSCIGTLNSGHPHKDQGAENTNSVIEGFIRDSCGRSP